MQIGIPKESLAGEARVAATPKTVKELKKLGFAVAVEANAGLASQFDDAAYREAGAEIVQGDAVYNSDLIYQINPPTDA